MTRVVAASSPPGGLVGDFFCGSGTTLVAAERLGRTWVGCDAHPLACHVAHHRLLLEAECGPYRLESTAPDPVPALEVHASLERSGRETAVRLEGVRAGAGLRFDRACGVWEVDWDYGAIVRSRSQAVPGGARSLPIAWRLVRPKPRGRVWRSGRSTGTATWGLPS
jgi:hypothetical protein